MTVASMGSLDLDQPVAKMCRNTFVWLLWFAATLQSIQCQDYKFTQDTYNATIPENAAQKTYVIPISRMGIWLDDSRVEIRYKIAKGERGSSYFKPERRIVGDFCFLLLRTKTDSRVLNRERQEYYILNIQAKITDRSGGKFSTKTKVIVKVLDANDLNPIFYDDTYDVTIGEDTPVHASIVTVKASDSDIGENGEVYYKFQKSSWSDTFAIHPVTGIVSLTRRLDYDAQNYYELHVEAEDRGPKIRSHAFTKIRPAKLRITVERVNVYDPEIKIQHLETLVEHGKKGTVYAILTVTDKDKSTNGQINSVKIVDGDPTHKFKIENSREKDEYKVEVVESLDRSLTPDGYNLLIRATDSGMPPRSTEKHIHISLMDKNDRAPSFLEKMYQISVKETVPVNTPLLFVKAVDSDYGQNAKLEYSILSGNDMGFFKVNSATGLVQTAKLLDAETYETVEIQIKAIDQGNMASRKQGSTWVKISVIDCNDNTPVFNTSDLSVKIEENQPAGTSVTQVFANDIDKDDNGYVSYSIVNSDEVPFRIDHFTGKIYTTALLDYESMRRKYHLKIRASDWGEPYRRENDTMVIVNVLNVNDNKPQFERVDCMGYISREAPKGTKIEIMSAIDFDVDSDVKYRIVSGNSDNCFSLNRQSGVLKLSCSLRDYKENERSVFITATDGINTAIPTSINLTLVNNNRNQRLSNSDASINCRITNATQQLQMILKLAQLNNKELPEDLNSVANIYTRNRFAPQFKSLVPSRIEVLENMQIDSVVLTASSDDVDHGFNGLVSYVISSGNEDGCFWIDTDTGDITIKSPLDRERKDKYTLNVTASDMCIPSKSSSKVIIIRIVDANDCEPEFEQTRYKVTISESVDVGTSVIKVSASDADLGLNARVKYSLNTDVDEFKVDSVTGVLRVASPLDREKRAKHDISIIAVDSAEVNPLTSTALVEITLLDVNDNAPKFIPDSYVVKIREDHPVNAIVMAVSAQDLDVGSNGVVRYKIHSGDDDTFDIDRQTGILRLTKDLDYEKQQVYNITVRAHDRGTPSKQSRTQVVVEVVDVNENLYAPRFPKLYAQGSVDENLPIGTSVMKLIAVDEDEGTKDKQIVYSIREGTGLGHFNIDSEGVIRTREVLDRESTHHYWLTVYAQDRGTVPLQSFIWVYIEILDVNDNVPQTVEPVYYPSVRENSPLETSVVHIVAQDKDQLSMELLTYEITSGDPQGFFTINQRTGLITTSRSRRKLDRESQSEHDLEVTISDHGEPELKSTCRVVVKVTDDNDHDPEFPSRIYRVQIPRNFGTEIPLYRVYASDLDIGLNGDVDYSFEGKGHNRFRINPKTGEISAARELEVKQYELTVKAADQGIPQRNSTCRVRLTILETPAKSMHPPVLKQAVQEIIVPEKEPVNKFVGQVQATDEDKDTLWYYFKDGNTGDSFTISTDTGLIFVAKPLDHETTTKYNLTVVVTDGVHHVQGSLLISVSDMNDNRPEFTRKVYMAEISENVPQDSSVLTVAATDKDSDSRLFYTMHSAAHTDSLRLFRINEQTGVVYTAERLDREDIQKHELTIMVRDTGLQPLRNFARVIIRVNDHNDYTPQFLSETFNGQVYETAAVGTAVMSVLAVDRDKGKNAEIHFSIISGNIGGAFTVDEMLGTIQVAKQLDLTNREHYNLVVKATDGGLPALSSTANVKITVTISNNAPPRFTHDEYSAEVSENRPIGTYITGVAAISRSSVVLEILAGNEQGYFAINPNSGVISTNVVLDYEESQYFNLTIRATNMVNIQAECHVLLHIINENDNRPEFTSVQYTGNITEGMPVGSVVLNPEGLPLVVHATDNDTHGNALLTYSIMQPETLEYFAIEVNTGAILTVKPLDHEAADTYSFNVQVKDHGRPSLTAEIPASVIIKVIDINDSPPVFLQEKYSATVLLPTYKDVSVITIEAKDPDTEVESKLTYSIFSGNEYNKFLIEEDTGILRIINEPDLSDHYMLVVGASDGKYETFTEVIVDVKRSASSGLKFSEAEYSASVMEEKTTVETLTVVQVAGHNLNEHLSFSILNPSKVFEIGKTSGVLRTTGVPFDRELQDSYKVVVQVEDDRSPKRTAHVLVKVTVQDKNDNKPVFVNQPYYTIVSIDSQKGDVIKQVSAIDRDINENSEIRYSITSDDSKFKINLKSGEISLRHTLRPSDQNKKFDLIVQADDKGSPAQSSTVVVPIQVLSKTTPIFHNPFYSVSIPEDVPLHHTITSLEAVSRDSKKLIYSIVKGDMYDEFAVDFNTDMSSLSPCFVTVIDRLDYEIRDHYELIVRATDTSTGAYTEVPLNIDIEDVNDNDPSFGSMMYYAQVSEAITVGTVLIEVAARDQDSGANSIINYRLEPAQTGANDSEYFYIDQTTGLIYLKHPLDYELHNRLHFLVVAEDSGNPSLSSTAHVYVTLKDLNDNPPVFTESIYNCTISDIATRGQFVAMVSASDPDPTDAVLLMYSIVGGNDKQYFAIDSNRGLISLSKLRRSVLHGSYKLNVSVSDGVFTNFAEVNVKVIPSNHFAPEFENVAYEISVFENITIGTSITQLKAFDKDDGHFGIVSYAINSNKLEKVFKIDSVSGELFTKAKLDREVTRVYEIPVIAMDFGGYSGFALVRIIVADSNDNPPQFLARNYKACVYSYADVGTSVAKVDASDPDEGENAEFSYSIFEETPNEVKQFFAINAETGEITVAKSLINSTNELYQFFITGKDNGGLVGKVPVEIYVMGQGDIPPKFQKERYDYFILEDMKLGYVAATLEASSNTTVYYSIVPGVTPDTNNPAKFNIDNEGKVEIIEELDADTVDEFHFTVQAETLTSPPLVSQTQVAITIMDLNDNPPVFDSVSYIASVNENAAVGTRVLKVSAGDNDTGSNADLSYSFASGSENIANIFTIDSETGWISTITSLDREAKSIYTLQILATDRGADLKLTGTAEVEIELIDHNDSPPIFSHSVYSGAVNEDALPGTIIVSISTTDADITSNADVTYYITDGDPLGQFKFHRTGEIFVSKPLDREATSSYNLEVTATDGAHVGIARVNIVILDANDNAPKCDQPMYQAVVKEDVSAGTFITRVAATDEDEPTTRNVRIAYSIRGEGAEYFNMHRATGIMTTAKELDRETQAEYHLIMSAKDGGGKSCEADIFITLNDVNDNVPKFSEQVYMVKVAENASINTLLTRISATDGDLGLNRKIQYELEDTLKGSFALGKSSGILSLAKKVDFEKHKYYNLTVRGIDQGAPQQSSYATVIVQVTDINDNTPEFERNKYKKSISENTRAGSSLLDVLATSRDSGVNAEITYLIVGGNEDGKFRIDAKSGAISLVNSVDYDIGDRDFFLTVQANTPSLSNTTIVEIKVTDSNDNPPVFAKESYTGIVVVEDAMAGDNVLQVQASDKDSKANAELRYNIQTGDNEDMFAINEHDGFITVDGKLDREKVSSYTLVVTAVDMGYPSLTGTVTVVIDVADANDNPPMFDSDNYTAVVQENRPNAVQLLEIKVTDLDLDPNGPPFQYDIIRGNERNELFHINQDGFLSTSARFDRKITDVYLLVVRVYDNGSPPLFSETTVTVNIVEESAFPPEVVPISLSVNAYLDEFPGGVIGKVIANDRDMYDRLSYGIVSDNAHLFAVDPHNGTITAKSLDSGTYNLNVSVSDGRYTVYGVVQLAVNSISQELLDSAVTVRLAKVTPENFVVKHKVNFIKLLKENIRSKEIHILSIQPSFDSGHRKRRDVNTDLDILVAARKKNGILYRTGPLSRKLNDALEKSIDFEVVKVFYDVCTKDFVCDEGEICKTFYNLNENEMVTVNTDEGSFVSFKYSVAPKCVCKGDACLDVVSQDPCSPNPCPMYQTCRSGLDMSYRCVCPEGRTGMYCEIEEPSNCVDPGCKKENLPMTFNGDGYARWRLVTSIERQLRLKLYFRTLQKEAMIMYAAGISDYSILEIIKGRIQYRFDCGSGPGYVLITDIFVNDGAWHVVEVERFGNRAKVILDSEYSAENYAPGINSVLNLSSNDVYFGAEVSGYTPRKGLRGCMKDITIDGQVLPYEGLSPMALDQSFENVEFGCKGTFVPGVCSSQPCKNNGVCIPSGVDKYRCNCQNRFLGDHCEYDSNPCVSDPCLYGGICKNLPNNFECKCKGRFKGKRCQYGYYCEPNPCQNNGVCEEGGNGAICNCKGFEGKFCEEDIDECRNNPCKNGAKCINTPGGFSCNCSTGSHGELCQVTNLAEIKSNSINLGIEEIIGIASVGVALILIVVVFVLVRRWRIRKRRESMQRHHSVDYDISHKEGFERNKLSNLETSGSANMYPPPSPRPPPVPTRPASYTPSNHDSLNTLNTIEAIRNEGDNNQQSVFSPQFLSSFQQDVPRPTASVAPSLPPPPPSNSASDTDSIQKPAWEFDCHNMNDNLAEAEAAAHYLDKVLPKELQASSSNQPGSLSSLPVSESEDDMMASRALSQLKRPYFRSHAGKRIKNKQGYHWDTSDWAPNPALPNITEVPTKEFPDSPSSSIHSNENNTDIGNGELTEVYPDSEYLENDSEYVGDSEYAENEFDDEDDLGDVDTDFPDPPEFTSQEDLALSEVLQHDYSMHPNQYLPTYSYTQSTEQLNNGTPPQLRHPQPARGRQRYDYNSDAYHTDFEQSAISGIDDSCLSVGYMSTNASMSDISGLCEIEDSEVNMSDSDDDADTTSNISAKMSNAHLHTQV